MSRTVSTSGPLTRYCTGQPTGGPSSSGETRPTASGNCSASSFSSRGCRRSRAGEVLRDDHGLGEEGVRQLHVERQVEADRAAADIGAPARDVRRPRRAPRRAAATAASLAWIEAFCGSVRSTSSSGRSEAGKNCCGTKRIAQTASAKSASVTRDGQPARPHRGDQERVVERAASAPGFAARPRLRLRRLQDRHADQRREEHRDEPGHDQRDADHGEDREGVFAGASCARSRSGRSRRW